MPSLSAKHLMPVWACYAMHTSHPHTDMACAYRCTNMRHASQLQTPASKNIAFRADYKPSAGIFDVQPNHVGTLHVRNLFKILECVIE